MNYNLDNVINITDYINNMQAEKTFGIVETKGEAATKIGEFTDIYLEALEVIYDFVDGCSSTKKISRAKGDKIIHLLNEIQGLITAVSFKKE